ncbi:MAG: efflux RND transporter periplasmic adaptor subunit [Patescibacteria group bacterium]
MFLGVLILLTFLFFRKPAVKVETVAVVKGDIVEAISASGEVDASEKADLIFQGSGKLAWVGVKEGDKVKKYQAIAKLDTVLLNASYQQAINSYTSYNAAAQKAEDDVIKGHSADETYAQKSTRVAAQVARDNAYDAMKAAEQSLKFATIYAPFDGVMTSVNPGYPGSNVTYTSAVYSIVNPETFYFSTEVGETEISKIKIGQKVTLYLDAYPNEKFESSVENIGISSVVTSTGGTAYKVKISLPKKDGVDFRLGMNGNAEIVANTYSNVISVTSDAVVEEDSGNWVWLVNGGGKVKKIKVVLGVASVDKNEIKEGVKEGDVVIVHPPTNLKNGTKISY